MSVVRANLLERQGHAEDSSAGQRAQRCRRCDLRMEEKVTRRADAPVARRDGPDHPDGVNHRDGWEDPGVE